MISNYRDIDLGNLVLAVLVHINIPPTKTNGAIYCICGFQESQRQSRSFSMPGDLALVHIEAFSKALDPEENFYKSESAAFAP